MSDFKFIDEPNVNIEELLYKIKILEERLVQKDELITILKEYNERFINHSENFVINFKISLSLPNLDPKKTPIFNDIKFIW